MERVPLDVLCYKRRRAARERLVCGMFNNAIGITLLVPLHIFRSQSVFAHPITTLSGNKVEFATRNDNVLRNIYLWDRT